jgi:hypothetical protein
MNVPDRWYLYLGRPLTPTSEVAGAAANNMLRDLVEKGVRAPVEA